MGFKEEREQRRERMQKNLKRLSELLREEAQTHEQRLRHVESLVGGLKCAVRSLADRDNAIEKRVDFLENEVLKQLSEIENALKEESNED